MSRAPQHEAILASAGSGKTFQLAHRYIGLLAADVDVSRICALTFSRKAAGEIFDSVVAYLCAAARDELGAAATAEHAGDTSLDVARFRVLLQTFLANLHRSQIGTLDSFIIGVVRAFPAELGIPSAFTVMDSEGWEADELKTRVLDGILWSDAIDDATRRQFLEAFKLATFGNEEKTLTRVLDGFLKDYRSRLRTLPDGSAWGERDRVWPEGSVWEDRGQSVAEAASDLLASVQASGLEDAPHAVWADFSHEIFAHRGGAAWSTSALGFFCKLLVAYEDLKAGRASVTVARKKREVGGDIAAAAVNLVDAVMADELKAARVKTAGIYRLLAQYEQAYTEDLRRRGAMTFEDAQYLLGGDALYGAGAVASRAPGQGHLFIDFRLDCQLDHWLLDEFQDTSDVQWATLRNLVDEVIQSGDGERSFFYVGDVKQAIYRWRGGNARLFETILNQYGPAIVQRPMDVSFRSCEPIIGAVNTVFGELPIGSFPTATRERWARRWGAHSSATGRVPASGYVSILEPPCEGGDVKPGAAERNAVIAGILRETEAVERGLSVGILVRSNKEGVAVINTIRAACPDIPVALDGAASIRDSPCVEVLLAVLRSAAHPADSLAWKHVAMSPLGFPCGPGDRDAWLITTLRDLQMQGFAPVLRALAKHLEDGMPDMDAFGRLRVADLLGAALEYDGGGGPRDIDAFLAYVDRYTVREAPEGGCVRVMTIHQSKGLGFDLVILPELASMSLSGTVDTTLVVKRNSETQEPQWALHMPRKDLAQADPVLAEAWQEETAEDAFEELCGLYVALTRAKRALYIVTSFPGKTSKAFTGAALVKEQLCGEAAPGGGEAIRVGDVDAERLYAHGDANWYAACPLRTSTPAPTPMVLPEDFAERASQRQALDRVLPSAADEHESGASQLFTPTTRRILDFGSAVHALFEQVEWADDCDVDALLAEHLPAQHLPDADASAVADQFRSAMASGAIRDALTRPKGDVAVWREKEFDLVLDDRLVTGIFDRVEIELDAGAPIAARILDYKTNRVESEADVLAAAADYAAQLGTYRRALARITGLPESAITSYLLFTQPRAVQAV